MDSNEVRHSAAHYFLEGLHETGFDSMSGNFGPDHRGELAGDPDAVEAAIARCLAALESGRSAVLHARVTRL
jgi:hypothetical protein